MTEADGAPPPIRAQRWAVALAASAFVVLCALGVWQVQRLFWKLALIEQVEARLAAPPVPAPAPADWPALGTEDAYRRLTVSGRYDHTRETCTQAVTVKGPGCWVMTPLQTDQGWWLLVNRGFVDQSRREPSQRAAGQVEGPVRLTGLLRLTEPGGGFLRANDPASDRWTSRDVQAIASARGLPLGGTAPYFVDAAETLPGGPVGGLTVVRFRNHHLVYALTWFSLGGIAAYALWRLLRHPKHSR